VRLLAETKYVQQVVDISRPIDRPKIYPAGSRRLQGKTTLPLLCVGDAAMCYDPVSGQWAIWWLDSRDPFANLDPPVKGNFVNGVGTFYSNDMLNGKSIRVRFVWSNITADGAHWEQAFSPDGGKTWEVNWTTDFKRAR